MNMGSSESEGKREAIITTDSNRTVIDVEDLERATSPLPLVNYLEAAQALLGPQLSDDPEIRRIELLSVKQLEACSRYFDKLVADIRNHPVIAAMHLAFQDHRPLVLSPDIVWLMIAHGFANHVNANAETLRSQFVQHADKVEIEVRRDDFVKGSPENPWEEAFGEFSNQIREHIGQEMHNLLLPRFSTTGRREQAAAEIALMDAVRSYFYYSTSTLCGIPEIVLEGTVADWTELADRTKRLSRFDLQWWTSALEPILEEFIAAKNGKPNNAFWKSIYKYNHTSGTYHVTGWITSFFPYYKDYETRLPTRKNRVVSDEIGTACEETDPDTFWDDDVEIDFGTDVNHFPSGLSKTPFKWTYFETKYQMEFLGGFVGVRQDEETLALRPEIGWAIREAQPVKK
jgi:hypothetical protein